MNTNLLDFVQSLFALFDVLDFCGAVSINHQQPAAARTQHALCVCVRVCACVCVCVCACVCVCVCVCVTE